MYIYIHAYYIFKKICLFILESQNYVEKDTEFFMCCGLLKWPQYPDWIRLKPGAMRLLRVPHGCNAQVRGPALTAFPDVAAGSWIRSTTAGAQTSTLFGCQHCTQPVNSLSHSTGSYHIFCIQS